MNDFQYNYSYTNIVYFGSSVLMDDILAKIPIVNGKLSLSVYDNNNPLNKIRLYNGPINLNRIAVKLYDKFGNIIDLNNNTTQIINTTNVQENNNIILRKLRFYLYAL